MGSRKQAAPVALKNASTVCALLAEILLVKHGSILGLSADDGMSYEIDLTDKNAKELRSAFSRYVEASCKISGHYVGQRSSGSSGTARSSSSKSDTDPQAVRAWAAANNIEVSARGHIPKSIVDQFRAADD
ncbi:histone-like nucleoid-structuring protein Lsr2 [Geodermatophilus sp. SYSU D00766]